MAAACAAAGAVVSWALLVALVSFTALAASLTRAVLARARRDLRSARAARVSLIGLVVAVTAGGVVESGPVVVVAARAAAFAYVRPARRRTGASPVVTAVPHTAIHVAG